MFVKRPIAVIFNVCLNVDNFRAWEVYDGECLPSASAFVPTSMKMTVASPKNATDAFYKYFPGIQNYINTRTFILRSTLSVIQLRGMERDERLSID